jgi:hypothetical protein
MLLRVLAGCLVLSSIAVVGCTSGYSDEDAVARCDQERDARSQGQDGSCMTDAAYQACVAAFTECGDEVEVSESCPTEFDCNEPTTEVAE